MDFSRFQVFRNLKPKKYFYQPCLTQINLTQTRKHNAAAAHRKRGGAYKPDLLLSGLSMQ